MDVISLQDVTKVYTHYAHGVDRLLELMTHRARHQSFTALHPITLNIAQGQVVGIVGNNGAGKSTLLKLVAKTLRPDDGICEIRGRVAALLELGAGFHPEMTGHENVYLYSTMMGLKPEEIDRVYDDIVAFSGIEDFMEQSVKTYSSGMFMRLAFAVATCVEPDILIIDEALSVGDGAFARKSFKRIMDFKESGKTILFCSHALYQVEAICDRVIWLDNGQVKQDGNPAEVISVYNEFIVSGGEQVKKSQPALAEVSTNITSKAVESGTARITEITVTVDGVLAPVLDAVSLQSELCITMAYASDLQLPTPTFGLLITGTDGRVISSAGTRHDGLNIQRHVDGEAKMRVMFTHLPLLKGEYWIDVYLLCENAIHVYDSALAVATLKVKQKGLEQGIVSLPRQWEQI